MFLHRLLVCFLKSLSDFVVKAANDACTTAACNKISSGLLSTPVSGLMGLAWKSIAASGAQPFWQALAAGGSWDSPLMSLVLTR